MRNGSYCPWHMTCLAYQLPLKFCAISALSVLMGWSVCLVMQSHEFKCCKDSLQRRFVCERQLLYCIINLCWNLRQNGRNCISYFCYCRPVKHNKLNAVATCQLVRDYVELILNLSSFDVKLILFTTGISSLRYYFLNEHLTFTLLYISGH